MPAGRGSTPATGRGHRRRASSQPRDHPQHNEHGRDELGLVLPAAAKLPPGVRISFSWVRVRGNRAFVSGHGALTPDGSPAGPFGKVPTEVSLEEAQESARLATLRDARTPWRA